MGSALRGERRYGCAACMPGLRGGQQEWELEYGRDGESEGRIRVRHSLSPRQVDVLLAGGGIPWMRRRLHGQVQKRTLPSP
jgi:hypothetical protein